MFAEYKPRRATDTIDDTGLGWLVTEFEPFDPDPRFTWDSNPEPPVTRRIPLVSKDLWPIVEIKHGPVTGARIAKCGGFYPSDTRLSDPSYVAGAVYKYFKDYMGRRYKVVLDKADFLQMIAGIIQTPEDRRLIADYLMWLQVCKREAAHLARMTVNPFLKGYISTARAFDTVLQFGSDYHKQHGWIYITLVHDGYIVFWDQKNVWGTEEGEIAQWGPIPAERIVGFTQMNNFHPVGPIYVRRSFRKMERAAFEYAFKVISGYVPPPS
jgi:hypothetical protein